MFTSELKPIFYRFSFIFDELNTTFFSYILDEQTGLIIGLFFYEKSVCKLKADCSNDGQLRWGLLPNFVFLFLAVLSYRFLKMITEYEIITDSYLGDSSESSREERPDRDRISGRLSKPEGSPTKLIHQKR